jgi:hypothetical protein
VSYRFRISPEYAYYKEYAWDQARSTAAKALSAKQDERTQLLYRGDIEWKYRRELKRVDADIVKLREELTKVEAEMPLINEEPVFGLIQANSDGTFPEAPQAGGERRFCQAQKADAFLAGTIREYHNRNYVTLRLYALYTNTVIYEDEIVFSTDDLDRAVAELAGRLTAVLAANKPAAVAVHAEPPETLVLINQSFAGRGTVEAQDHPPGKVAVALSAEGYKPEFVESVLFPGELTDIRVNLPPQEYTEVTILPRGGGGGMVYQGAMYVGEAPLTLRLPHNQFNYISVETADGKIGKAAFTTPDGVNQPFTFSLKPKVMHSSAEQRVNKARKSYYWAWGGTWIAAIAAWIVNGMVRSNMDSMVIGIAETPPVFNTDFYNDTLHLYDISKGVWAAVGVAAAFEVFQMARYIYIATEDNTPLVRPDINRGTQE